MTTNNAERWIEAGIVLADDPDAKVMCPVCANDFLRVEDVEHPDGTLFDRYLRCETCGAEEVLVRLRR